MISLLLSKLSKPPSKASCFLLNLLAGSLLVLSEEAKGQFIVDTKNPVVIVEQGTNPKNGGGSKDNNLFGYSMSYMKGAFGDPGVKFEHQRDQRQDSSTVGTLFIGAPDEKNVTKNSGVVWQCKFMSDGGYSCSLLNQLSGQLRHPESSDRGCDYQSSVKYPEAESEQWIGASLSSTSSQLLACAPRWKRNGFKPINAPCSTETAMVGACYRASSPNNIHQLSPLNDNRNFYFPGTGENGGKISEYFYLYAQFGFSSHVTSSDDLLMGAPCARKWTGMFVEYLENRPYLYNSMGTVAKLKPHSLLGYTITSGRRVGQTDYMAVGAPRALNLNGAVILFSSRANSELPIAILRGKQFGGYFGYSLATADLDGDGNDELLVGAPMQSSDPRWHDTGCVSIYRFSDWSNPIRPALCPYPESTSLKVTKGARFGSAIANLGDINFDKKEDFAISAPYDNEEGGTIFIFYGSIPPVDTPSQIIRSESMSIPNLKGFGTTLLTGTPSKPDIDGNGTPDLAIGSFESGHVIVLRTRPVARVNLRVTFHSLGSQGGAGILKTFLPDQTGMRVRTCINFQFSVPLPQNTQFDTWIKFEVDPKEKRFDFDDRELAEIKHKASSKQQSCLDRILKTVKDLVAEDANSKIPITFMATLWYNETAQFDDQPVQHSTIVLSPNQGASQNGLRGFNPFLPAPIPRTDSARETLIISDDNCKGDGIETCDPELILNVNAFHQNNPSEAGKAYNRGQSLVIGQVDSIELQMSVENRRETAYRPVLNVSFEFDNAKGFQLEQTFPRLEWSQIHGKPGECVKFGGRIKETSYVRGLRCLLPLHNKKMIKHTLRLTNLKDIKVKEKLLKGSFRFHIEAYPEGQQQQEMVYKDLEIPMEPKILPKIMAIDPPEGQSAIDPKTSLLDLTQIFILKNGEYSATAMDQVKLEIHVPTFFKTKKKEIEILGIAQPTSSNFRCKADKFEFYDPSESPTLTTSQEAPPSATKGRSKRATKGGGYSSSKSAANKPDSSAQIIPEKSTAPPPPPDSKMIVLKGCSSSCRTVICYTDLPSKDARDNARVLEIKMFLKKNLTDDIVKEDTSGIYVESKIQVSCLGKEASTQGVTQRRFFLTKSIPALIYVGAVGGGLLLLIAVIFLLHKCGFFRRKKKEELQQIKRQTMVKPVAMENLHIPGVHDEPEEVEDD